MKRYLELESLFVRIGVDITTAKARAATHVLSMLPPLQKGDVQNGLLAPAENALHASSILPSLSSCRIRRFRQWNGIMIFSSV